MGEHDTILACLAKGVDVMCICANGNHAEHEAFKFAHAHTPRELKGNPYTLYYDGNRVIFRSGWDTERLLGFRGHIFIHWDARPNYYDVSAHTYDAYWRCRNFIEYRNRRHDPMDTARTSD